MMGKFHLITQQSYFVRDVDCGPGCAGDRTCMLAPTPEHQQKYAEALCDAEVVKYRDEYCAVGIAVPRWDKDWCPGCIARVVWNLDEMEDFRARGLFDGRETMEAGMRFAAESLPLTDAERDERRDDTMRRARLSLWHTFTPVLADWLQQVLVHVDEDGPKPEYWPEVERVGPRR